MRESAVRAFQAYGRPLDMATYLKYLGRILTASCGNWPAVVVNLWKSLKSCACLSIIMGREGASTRLSGIFFK